MYAEEAYKALRKKGIAAASKKVHLSIGHKHCAKVNAIASSTCVTCVECALAGI